MEKSNRKHPRISGPKVLVRIPTLEKFRTHYLRDLSQGGLFVKTDKPVSLNTVVEIDLDVPSWEKRLALRGRVVRSDTDEHAQRNHAVGFAVQFEELSEETEQRLSRLIAEHAAMDPTSETARLQSEIQRLGYELGALHQVLAQERVRNQELEVARLRQLGDAEGGLAGKLEKAWPAPVESVPLGRGVSPWDLSAKAKHAREQLELLARDLQSFEACAEAAQTAAEERAILAERHERERLELVTRLEEERMRRSEADQALTVLQLKHAGLLQEQQVASSGHLHPTADSRELDGLYDVAPSQGAESGAELNGLHDLAPSQGAESGAGWDAPSGLSGSSPAPAVADELDDPSHPFALPGDPPQMREPLSLGPPAWATELPGPADDLELDSWAGAPTADSLAAHVPPPPLPAESFEDFFQPGSESPPPLPPVADGELAAASLQAAELPPKKHAADFVHVEFGGTPEGEAVTQQARFEFSEFLRHLQSGAGFTRLPKFNWHMPTDPAELQVMGWLEDSSTYEHLKTLAQGRLGEDRLSQVVFDFYRRSLIDLSSQHAA